MARRVKFVKAYVVSASRGSLQIFEDTSSRTPVGATKTQKNGGKLRICA